MEVTIMDVAAIDNGREVVSSGESVATPWNGNRQLLAWPDDFLSV
jgi:hypothetical protein